MYGCGHTASDLTYVRSNSAELSSKHECLYYKNEKFDGVIFDIDPITKDTIFVETYSDGLLHGISRKWFSKDHLMEQREYAKGQKHGKQTAFWENGNKRFEYTAVNDVCEGEMKEWTVEGNLFHLANYVKGQEEGTQKLWYENGKIRANYVIVNGRRYGLLGTKNCKNVSDSIFGIK